MQIGDLVKYWNGLSSIGVVIQVWENTLDGYNTDVLWADGTTTTHSSSRLIRLEDIK
tara:strand:- start:350 stop:520 length:171 start_codon:yes stop_codon:yes gene_type:complete